MHQNPPHEEQEEEEEGMLDGTFNSTNLTVIDSVSFMLD